MSKSVIFFVCDDIKFEKMEVLSKELVLYCVKKNLGIIFNSLEWNTNFAEELNANFYFIITDNFFEHNCDFLTTKNILNINKKDGRHKFYNSFSFFDEIYNILINNSIKKFFLLISYESNEISIKEFTQIKKENKLYVEIIYSLLMKEKNKYAYDFPSILISNT